MRDENQGNMSDQEEKEMDGKIANFDEAQKAVQLVYETIEAINKKSDDLGKLLIDPNLIKHAYRAYLPGALNNRKTRIWWENWMNNCDWENLNQERRDKERIKFKNRYMYSRYINVVFKKEVNMPQEWNLFRSHEIRCITKQTTKLEDRLKILNQCRICGDIYCENGKCREFNRIVSKRKKELGWDEARARRSMRTFCKRCGETGGHCIGRCLMEEANEKRCKFCNSKEHDSRKNDQCPYWVGLVLLSFEFNDQFIRNMKIGRMYKSDPGNLDQKWKPREEMQDFEIDKIDANAKREWYQGRISDC